MPHTCAVVDCKNGYSKGGNKKLYHFPTDKDMGCGRQLES